MDSGTEVLRAVTAIVVAFETAADALESIRDHKEKKKRKREKDLEELLEIKILHKSLLHGAKDCGQHCEHRQRQFGSAFGAGDAIVLPALSGVVIALQTEIHQRLHRVRNVETATLDLTALHESSITSRKDATRAMDQLCQRIMASIRYQSQQPDDKPTETWSPSDSSMRSGSASVQPPSLNESCEIPPALPLQVEKKLPLLPAAIGHAGRVIYQPLQRVFPQRAVSIRRSSDATSQKRYPRVENPPSQTTLRMQASNTSLVRSNKIDSERRQQSPRVQTRAPYPDVTRPENRRESLPRRRSVENSIVSSLHDTINGNPDRASTSSIQPSVFLVSNGDEDDIKASSPTSITSYYAYQDMGTALTPSPSPERVLNGSIQQSPEPSEQENGFLVDGNDIPPVREPHFQPLPTVDEPAARVATPVGPTCPIDNHAHSAPESTPTSHEHGALPMRHQIERHTLAPLQFTIDSGDYGLVQPQPDQRPSNLGFGIAPGSDKETDVEEVACNEQQQPPPSAFAIDGGVEVSLVGSPPPVDDEQNEIVSEVAQRGYAQDIASIEVDTKTAPVSHRAWLPSQEKDFEEAFHALRTPDSIENITEAQFKEKLRPVADLANEKFSASLTQADYQERLLSLPKGQDNVWLPLPRPALHNRYHGFCKGAWQIRKAADEGLQVHLTPSVKEPVIHWQCTACNFKSKAPNADALPTHILFNQKYNVRYRWIFLAKSHRSANASLDTPEGYEYGCIFCAAQGHATAFHEKLEHLFVHIMSKHKAAMMTPELKVKTKAITGGVTDKTQEWDIVLPESGSKGVGTTADELRISAGKFWSRRKGKK